MAAEAAGLQTKCQNCGGQMAFDGPSQMLKCQSCGSTQEVADTGGAIVNHDLESALTVRKPRGRLGAGARQVKCNECGAVVEFPDNVTASKCSFCDSPSVLPSDARDDLIKPESLIPFKVTRDQAGEAFKKWLGGLWFRPSDLKEKSSISELRGVYIPYWTFDTEVTSRWTGDAGYYYHVEVEYFANENGQQVKKTKQERRTRWEPASGQRHDSYVDLLVCASKGLPEDLTRGIDDFQTSGLQVDGPQYLEGFSAESYAIELRDGWKKGQDVIAAKQLRKCEGDVPGDEHRNVRATHQYQSTKFKHVLLPVWIAAFRYNDQVFRFLVNGQTSKVSGKAPLSWTKIILFIAAIVVAIALLVVLLKH